MINRPLIRVIALQFAWNPVHAIAVTAAVAVLATVVVLVPIAILFDMVSCSASRSVAKFGMVVERAAATAAAPADLRQFALAVLKHGGQAQRVLAGEAKPQAAEPPRVRDWFPETLLWRPELITDEQGRATLDLDLADSITTWRLSASAVTADGQLGADQASIRVFQPFFVDLNLPVALTRGDEVTVPVVVYNYLDRPQTVELKLTDGSWFKRLGKAAEKIELAAGEVRNVGYRLRAQKAGRFELEVSARGSGVADAVRRPIEVLPDGRLVERVFNGTLQQPADIACSAPPQAIEGSVKAIVKIYPSSFSQVVEGLDAIFQRPYGCFEQTSSTTYPNVLALDYLRQNKKNVPAVEAKANQYIHLGYQRLLSFEVPGGGFDWFGRPPANRTLTAYGLMEFEDMARVHDVDPDLVERTRQWLLGQRQADGSWEPEGQMLHDGLARDMGQHAGLGATAYIAWAVYGGGGHLPVAGHATVPALPSAGGDRRRLRPGAGGQRAAGAGSKRRGRRALSRPAGSPETVLGRRKDRLVGRACGPDHVLRRRPLRQRRNHLAGGLGDAATPVTIRLPPAARLSGSPASATAAAPGTRPRRPCWP